MHIENALRLLDQDAGDKNYFKFVSFSERSDEFGCEKLCPFCTSVESLYDLSKTIDRPMGLTNSLTNVINMFCAIHRLGR